jgi:hypothetical protein
MTGQAGHCPGMPDQNYRARRTGESYGPGGVGICSLQKGEKRRCGISIRAKFLLSSGIPAANLDFCPLNRRKSKMENNADLAKKRGGFSRKSRL